MTNYLTPDQRARMREDYAEYGRITSEYAAQLFAHAFEADRQLAKRDDVICELEDAILAYSDADKGCECCMEYGCSVYCDSCKEAALKDDPDACHPDEFYRYKHGVASGNLHKLAKKIRKIGGAS